MIDRLLELAALDAAGALAYREHAELAALLADANQALRRDVAALYESAAVLPASTALQQPSPAVRDRILAHAARR